MLQTIAGINKFRVIITTMHQNYGLPFFILDKTDHSNLKIFTYNLSYKTWIPAALFFWGLCIQLGHVHCMGPATHSQICRQRPNMSWKGCLRQDYYLCNHLYPVLEVPSNFIWQKYYWYGHGCSNGMGSIGPITVTWISSCINSYICSQDIQ